MISFTDSLLSGLQFYSGPFAECFRRRRGKIAKVSLEGHRASGRPPQWLHNLAKVALPVCRIGAVMQSNCGRHTNAKLPAGGWPSFRLRQARYVIAGSANELETLIRPSF